TRLSRLSIGLLLLTAVAARADGPIEWPFYGGTPGGTRFSAAADITPANVSKLRVAWTYRTGELAALKKVPEWAFETTPLMVGDRLYLSTPLNEAIALDAETGRELWRFDPQIDRDVTYGNKYVSRGVAFWESSDAGACATRIFMATNDARIFALDAESGKPCRDFGEKGSVSLHPDGEAMRGEYQITSAPTVADGLVIIGSSVADNLRVEAPRGTVRALDARTGAIRWSWDPLSESRTAPGFRAGAANAWAGMSVDEARHLVFIPTGSPSPDYYGGFRPGDNRDADSIIALDIATGKVVWRFQTVHHDIWDYDVASQPSLLSLDGHDAVAQVTKTGNLFLLDRATGAPLRRVEERRVPASDVPGEQISPTQPYSVELPPLAPQSLSQKDIWGVFPWDRCRCRRILARSRNEGMFTPPSTQGTILYPGPIGGAAWGGSAFDSSRQLLVINTNHLAATVRLVPREQFGREPGGKRVELGPQSGAPFALRREFLLGYSGLPCNRPPWGTLQAIDLSTGKVRWIVPLGTLRDVAAILRILGPSGSPNLGAPIVTGSGLIFIGAAMDNFLRAFDLETGKELWKGRLPAGGQATPLTYRTRSGKQFVVIAAGGHTRLGTKRGDSIVAFALP
ncbi:MAG TPA: pyrroloquinoline quinone-dependent dehydrogenase, partial [Thermoanaerobaculia bacterium]|nr:pyrroloquinoline quinone-dependent dehydrogenase [Thermoanaerobaculia bacterium]